MPYNTKEKMYSYQIQRWKKRKIKAISYKGDVCSVCGESYPPPAMQFHHIDPSEKEFMWNKLRQMSWDKIQKELDKCVLVCANCHSIIHGSN